MNRGRKMLFYTPLAYPKSTIKIFLGLPDRQKQAKSGFCSLTRKKTSIEAHRSTFSR